MNIKRLIWSLEALSDKAMQENLWRGLSQNEMWTFEEAQVQAFDDSGLADALNSKSNKYRISDQFREKATNLDRLVRAIPFDYDIEELLAGSKIEKIRNAALELLDVVVAEYGNGMQ
jgi:hypothetical protein